MWEFLELEEQIGRYWHRLVGKVESYAYYPDAAVTLDSVRSSLSVFFRGLGGAPGIALTAVTPQSSGHRLSLKQRLGMEQESMPSIECNVERMLLPATIACFPSITDVYKRQHGHQSLDACTANRHRRTAADATI